MPDPIIIPARFNGPPASGHGGYTSGRLAALVPGVAEVTLRQPPPLDVPLVPDDTGEVVRVMHGDTLVAEVRPGAVDTEPVAPVDLATAAGAAASYAGLEDHVFPTCFACGPAREPGDGLRIFPGPVDGGDVHAAPWTPDERFGERAPSEIVWAALDCPGAWAWLGRSDRVMVLGRMTLEERAPVRAGVPHVVVAWGIGEDGRKSFSGTALYDADGELKAIARTTWVALRP